MPSHPSRFFVTVAANAVAMAVALSMLVVVWAYGQALEPIFSPIITFEPTNSVYRDEIKACFALHIKKQHVGIPLKYTFFVEAKLSAKIPVSAYLANPDHMRLADSDLQTHGVGTEWTRYYCFEIPQTISEPQEMRVTGFAEHNRHPFWTTLTPVPPFIIGPSS